MGDGPVAHLSSQPDCTKMTKDAKSEWVSTHGASFDSTGQEISRQRLGVSLELTPAQAGSLYLLNEGAERTASSFTTSCFRTGK